MRYAKGTSGNPAGRPMGSKNKVTAKVIDLISLIVEENLPRIRQDLDELEPKDRLRFIASLFAYIVPKQQSIAPYVEEPKPKVDNKIIVVSGREEIERLDAARQALIDAGGDPDDSLISFTTTSKEAAEAMRTLSEWG